MTARRGFTLIELLVVIAIIAILAAILFPVFARARSAARTTVCLSNVKQLGTGLMMYVQDYDEKFPNWNWSFFCNGANNGAARDSSAFWTNSVLPYVKNQQIYQCSEDILDWDDAWATCGDDNGKNDKFGPYSPQGVQCNYWDGCNPNFVSYGLEEALTGGNSFNKLAAVVNPSNTLMIADNASQLANAWPDPNIANHIVGRVAFSSYAPGCCMMWEDWGTPAQWLQHYTQAQLDAAPRHHGGNNLTFVDSHAKFYQWSKLTDGNLTGMNN